MQKSGSQGRDKKAAVRTTPNVKRTAEKFNILLVFLSAFSFLFGFYLAGSLFFAGSAWFVRFFIVLVSCGISLALLWPTHYRERIWALFKGARIELYKVFWPSRDEAVKTTLLVLMVVALFALFFTIIDGILTILVKWIL